MGGETRREPIGDFEVTTTGNSVSVTTSNDSGSVFDNNHESLTIGISDPTGCYSLSPAVPFALLLAAEGEVVERADIDGGNDVHAVGTDHLRGTECDDGGAR